MVYISQNDRRYMCFLVPLLGDLEKKRRFRCQRNSASIRYFFGVVFSRFYLLFFEQIVLRLLFFVFSFFVFVFSLLSPLSDN